MQGSSRKVAIIGHVKHFVEPYQVIRFPTWKGWHGLDSTHERKGHSLTTTNDPKYHGWSMCKGSSMEEDIIGYVRECVESYKFLSIRVNLNSKWTS